MSALEVVKQYYDSFNNGNWEAMLALVSDNIRHEPNQADQPRIGKELFQAFMAKMDEAYQEKLTDMVFMTEPTGTRVAVEFVVNGIYKKAEEGLPAAHGQTYILPAGAFLSVENGLITRVTTYYNLEEWIKLVS